MKKKIMLILLFFLPILFSGSSPPSKEVSVVKKIKDLNRDILNLTKFIKNHEK